MIVKQIKLSSQSKDRLGRLKGKTGIKNWNVLCRWAFCYSLGEYSMPTDIPVNTDSNVEMSWFTFAGEYSDLYDALINERCYKDAFSNEKAFNMIMNGECGTFSPKLLETFKQVRDKFERFAIEERK